MSNPNLTCYENEDENEKDKILTATIDLLNLIKNTFTFSDLNKIKLDFLFKECDLMKQLNEFEKSIEQFELKHVLNTDTLANNTTHIYNLLN